jgi:hypothetical protein
MKKRQKTRGCRRKDRTTDIGKTPIGCGGQCEKKANILGEDERLVEIN